MVGGANVWGKNKACGRVRGKGVDNRFGWLGFRLYTIGHVGYVGCIGSDRLCRV